ncbi:MAG: hypothetical protein SOY58_03160, partial [Candidatus Onthovivens sp.]|nr:hypothetical protein [Candidatus Onthovivens sp.]
LFSVLGLAAISIGTVGFATWMVGVQKKEESLTINALVDNTLNNSIYLEAEITVKDVVIAESEEHLKTVSTPATDIVFASKKDTEAFTVNENALKFTFSTLQFSKGTSVEPPTQLKLELMASDNNTVLPIGNLTGRDPAESWTYLKLEQTIDLNSSMYTRDDTVTGKSYETYKFNTTTYSLEWGTFFGNERKSPVQYYNALAATGNKTVAELFELSDNVYSEISTMKTKLVGNLTVKVSII